MLADRLTKYESPEETRNIIAKFKAKYAISNTMMAKLCNVEPIEIKNWMDTDSAPDEANRLAQAVELIIEYMIGDYELMKEDHAYIQVLERKSQLDTEMRQNASVKIEAFETMGLFKRLLFLFNIRDD